VKIDERALHFWQTRAMVVRRGRYYTEEGDLGDESEDEASEKDEDFEDEEPVMDHCQHEDPDTSHNFRRWSPLVLRLCGYTQ
jgi:MoaA/NifB/PqqE/SkfB family radical SAM enzyme